MRAGADEIQVLIVARFLQGLGGAAGMAISNAAVTDYVRGREAARLLSRLAIVGGVAPIVAPLAGGQLLRVLSWRGLFVVLTAIALTLFLSVLIGLPESLPRERRTSAGLGSLLATLLALTRDLRFMGFALTSALSFAGFFAYLAGSSFVYQEVYGVSPAAFSVLFAANAVGMLGASELNHRLLVRFSPAQLLAAALAVNAAAGGVVLTVLLVGGLGVWPWRRHCGTRRPHRARRPELDGAGPVAAPGRRRKGLRVLRHPAAGPRRPGDPPGRPGRGDGRHVHPPWHRRSRPARPGDVRRRRLG